MPSPKPTKDHERDGTYQPCRHDDRADVHYPTGRPDMPSGLDPRAQWLWKLVEENVPESVLSPVDAALLLYLCRWWSLWREYDLKLDQGEGDPYKTLVMSATAGKKVMEGLAKFGLSPRDRASLKVPPAPQEQTSALQKLFDMRSRTN